MSALDHRNTISDFAARLARLSGRFAAPSARVQRIGIFCIEAACVAFIALSASNIALMMMTPANIGAVAATALKINTENALPTGGMAQQAFFKSLDGKAAPLAEANAKIKLFGTRPSGSGMGTAIISVNGGTQQSVSSGARLKNGARITGIYSDRIEINANGDAGAIYLLPAKQRNQRKLVSKISASELSGLSQVFDLRMANQAARIGAAADGTVLALLGLANGDKIISIDKAVISDEAALEAAFNRLLAGNAVSLEIERGDAKIVKIINAADVQNLLGAL